MLFKKKMQYLVPTYLKALKAYKNLLKIILKLKKIKISIKLKKKVKIIGKAVTNCK